MGSPETLSEPILPPGLFAQAYRDLENEYDTGPAVINDDTTAEAFLAAMTKHTGFKFAKTEFIFNALYKSWKSEDFIEPDEIQDRVETYFQRIRSLGVRS